MLDFTNTPTFLMAVEQLKPASSFLKDRYFPTNPRTDIFNKSEVLIEYKSGNKKLAPFVSPRKGGVTMLRDGYKMETFEPACIKPQRILTLDVLERKGFGEALFSDLSASERQNLYLLQDAKELGEAITRREEAMAAEVMLNNKVVCKEISDDENKPEEKEIQFFDGESNPAVYTPSASWTAASAPVYDDIYEMIKLLSAKGLPAEDLVCSPDVAEAIIKNEGIKEMLNNRRMEMGLFDPEQLTPAASLMGILNVAGRNINIISYAASYTNDEGTDTLYIPSGKCVLTSPGAGKTVYGAVSQVEQSDNLVHTYASARVPKYLSDAQNDKRSITITSKPLPMPIQKNCFISADVIF